MTEILWQDFGNVDRYRRSDADLHELTLDLIATHESYNNERFVCYYVSGDSPHSDIARTLERRVFEEAFEGNDAAFMKQEYGPYEEASKFFISVDRATGTPTGALRVIEDSEVGFKTFNDLDARAHEPQPLPPYLDTETIIKTHAIDPLKCWDIGTVAIPKDFRQSGVSTQLYRGMYGRACYEGIDHFVSIIDERPLFAMRHFLNIPFVPMCDSEPFEYLGSPKSEAVYGHVSKFDPVINNKLDTLTAEVERAPSQTDGEVIFKIKVIKALAKIIRGTEDEKLFFKIKN